MTVPAAAPMAGDRRARSARWRCPDCGRGFARRRQPHSCKRLPIEEHFPAGGISRPLLDALVAAIRADVGPCELLSLPCCIHLTATEDFLAVLPKRDQVEVRFTLHRRVHGPRIVACAQTSRSAYKHRVDVAAVEDIDAELLAWIGEAYHLGEVVADAPPAGG
jgi:hypothetical protein